MTLNPDHIFAIVSGLFCVCIALGGFVVRGALGRIKDLEDKKYLDSETHEAMCESAQQKSLIARSKADAELHRKINKIVAVQYLIAGSLGIDIKGIDPE